MRRSFATAAPAVFAAALFTAPLALFAQPPAPQVTVVAGIEVGSKSVKGVVLQLSGRTGVKQLKPEITEQTNLSANLVPAVAGKGPRFDDNAMTRTADAVEKVHGAIIAANPNVSQFVLVASSGVAGAVDSDGFEELVGKIGDKKISRLPRLEPMNPAEEVRLTFLGVVERKDRDSTLSLDIGSGNTKFGYAVPGRAGEWKTSKGVVPLGSNTLAGHPQAPKVDPALKGDAYHAQVEVFSKWAQNLLTHALAEEKAQADDKGRDTVYLTGGIVWAMVSLLKPELENKHLVPVSAETINAFVAQARSDDPYGDGKPRNAAAEKQARAVKAVFNRAQILAGAEILKAASDAFGVTAADHGMHRIAYFARDGLFAWIIGRAQELIENSRATAGASLSEDVFIEKINELKAAVSRNDTVEFPGLIDAINSGFKTVVDKISAPAPPFAPAPVPVPDLSPITKAINELKQEVIKLQKPSPSSSTPSVPRDTTAAWSHFFRGMELYSGGWPAQAQAHFNAALAIDGEEPRFQYGLALAKCGAGDIAGARATATKLARDTSGYPYSAVGFGRTFERVQNDDRRTVEQFLREFRDEQLLRAKVSLMP
jgi:hypothetical protein